MDWPPVSIYPEAFSSSSRYCAKRESAIFWRLDHWGNGRGFRRFCAVAYADFQLRWLYKSFFDRQADRQRKESLVPIVFATFGQRSGMCEPNRFAQNLPKPLALFPVGKGE